MLERYHTIEVAHYSQKLLWTIPEACRTVLWPFSSCHLCLCSHIWSVGKEVKWLSVHFSSKIGQEKVVLISLWATLGPDNVLRSVAVLSPTFPRMTLLEEPGDSQVNPYNLMHMGWPKADTQLWDAEAYLWCLASGAVIHPAIPEYDFWGSSECTGCPYHPLES